MANFSALGMRPHPHPVRQGRPLADWTDCFQSGPAPKGALRYAYELTLPIESVRIALARGPQYLLSVRSVENHRKQK